jgi:hypothetical protein
MDYLKILEWKHKRRQFLSIASASAFIQKGPSQRFRQLNTLEINSDYFNFLKCENFSSGSKVR